MLLPPIVSLVKISFLLGKEVSSIILRVLVLVSIKGLKVFIPPKATEILLHKNF
jgi:hypothetical protein